MKKVHFLLVLVLLLLTPVHGYDNHNTFSSDYTREGVLEEKVSKELNVEVSHEPFVHDDKVFLLTSNELKVLNESLHELWSYETGIVEGSLVLLDDSIIIAGRKSGEELIRLDYNGSVVWSESVPGGFTTTPVIHENVIILSRENQLIGYFLTNGSELWNNSIPLTSTNLFNPGCIQ